MVTKVSISGNYTRMNITENEELNQIHQEIVTKNQNDAIILSTPDDSVGRKSAEKEGLRSVWIKRNVNNFK